MNYKLGKRIFLYGGRETGSPMEMTEYLFPGLAMGDLYERLISRQSGNSIRRALFTWLRQTDRLESSMMVVSQGHRDR